MFSDHNTSDPVQKKIVDALQHFPQMDHFPGSPLAIVTQFQK